uniref:Nuclear receptor domain-containing protein n=1 Tax=Panagrolaimus sp. PS1159 TaxID=55785 RepID=A0AC35GI78_9BILA
MNNNLNKDLNEYICTVCARPQPSNQIRHGGLCCNACAAFFQRTVFMEPSLKCKRTNSCFNSQTTMISSCRKCRYTKCLEVGMPYPKITTVTAFTLTQEEALICAHTIDAFLTTCESNPRLLESSFDKVILEIFNHSFNAAKKLAEKANEIPGKIQALAQLLFTNPISMDGGLYQICYISICKLKFGHVQTSEKEKITQLQNDAYLKLENEKMNIKHFREKVLHQHFK